MNSLNIDFRAASLRVLSAKAGAVKHVHLTQNFSLTDMNTAKEQLTNAIKEVGGKKGKASVILPNRIVKFNILEIPAMDLGDAEKVVKRDITKEIGTPDFVLGIRRIIRNRPGKQDILAEYALKSDLQPYLTLLKECGIKPTVLTTSLEGIISAFKKIRPETEGNEAVLEIGQTFIEIIVFNDGKLIKYKKVQMPAVDETKLSRKDMDPLQICKIKMYTIVDALYNFIMETGSGSAEDKISRLWISGRGSIEEGTTQCVSEGLGMNSSLLNPFVYNPLQGTGSQEGNVEIEHASIYTALVGLSLLTPADQIINLIPSDERDKGKQVIGKTALIAALVFYVILIGGGYAVLIRTEKDLKSIKEKSEAELRAAQKTRIPDNSQQDALRKIMSNNKNLYPLFRDLASLIPPAITLSSLDIEKTADATFIKLGASLQPTDEGLRKSAISKFLHALETTGRFGITSPPEISTTTSAPNVKKQEFAVKAKFEVLQ